jgi:hypothetical protein
VINGKNILLTAFRGSSSEVLLKSTEIYETLILPNDKINDSIKLIDMISKEKYDYIISFGQKPNINKKVHIETKALNKDIHICTNFDCKKLELLFKQR